MRLARWGDNGAALDHVHDDVGGELFRVFADAASVSAVRVDAGPDEEDEVAEEGEELADGCGGVEIGTEGLDFPEVVYVCVLLLAGREHGVVARGLCGVAGAVLAVVGVVLGRLPYPCTIAGLLVVSIFCTSIAHPTVEAPIGDAQGSGNGAQSRADVSQPKNEVDADLSTGVDGGVRTASEEGDYAGRAPYDGKRKGDESPRHEPFVVEVVGHVQRAARAVGNNPCRTSNTNQSQDYGQGPKGNLPLPVRIALA